MTTSATTAAAIAKVLIADLSLALADRKATSQSGDGKAVAPHDPKPHQNLMLAMQKTGRQAGPSGPMPTFATLLGGHFCECWHQRTTSKLLMLVELWI